MDKNDFLKYFQLNKFLLNFCGVLPIETWGLIPNAVLIILSFCSTSFLVLPFLYTLFFQSIEFETAMDIFCLLLEGMAATCKALLLWPKRKKLSNLVYLCNSLWKNIKDEEEAETVKHYASRGMFFTYGFFFNILIALTNVLVQPAFAKFVFDSNGTLISSKTLPFPSGLFHENVQVFNVWYILQVPVGIVVMILIVAIDTSVVVFVLHACAHFNLLQFRLWKLKQLHQDDCQNRKPKETFGNIVTIVKFHQDVLQYSAAVEDIFNPVVLLQTVLSILAICIFGINIMLKDEDILNQVLHVVGGIMQLLMFCWPPNNLQTEILSSAYSFFTLLRRIL